MNQILKPILQELNNRCHQEHPSAEAIAAFQENNLLSHEREMLLSHFAVCRFCRECLSVSTAGEELHRSSKLVWRSMGTIAACLCVAATLWQFHSRRLSEPQIPKPIISNVSATTQRPAAPTLSNVKPLVADVLWRFQINKGLPILQKSDNGGKSWKAAMVPEGIQVESLAWSGPHIWIRSTTGQIMESHNAGVSWIPILPRPQEQLAGATAWQNRGNSGDFRKLTVITAAGQRWTRVNGIWHRQTR